ncbi:MAG TPA: PAS domain-containing protein, partial [Steroidobacteraceae bacterium]
MGKDQVASRLRTCLGDSDARHRLAIEAAGLATFDVDIETGAAIWSDTLFTLLGYPISATGVATFDMWRSRLHPDDAASVLAMMERAKQDHTLFRCEHRIVRADTGEVIWLEPRGRFLYDANGRVTRLVGVYLEITARKQAEERLVQREMQIELAARIVGLGIFDHDHQSNRLYWS